VSNVAKVESVDVIVGGVDPVVATGVDKEVRGKN